MSIGPISAAASTAGISGISGIGTVGGTTATAASGGGTGNMAIDLIDGLQNQQNNADSLALQASMGNGNVGDVMIAATQASLSTNMTVAVRNKAVEAFNQIMGMQF
ncbi:hypothetical protein acdb102_25790 [Acidothermaceae bacterium B102]|nr:hypothetical protein acdb102_25790 [Acidothermaceae bacterium B102]